MEQSQSQQSDRRQDFGRGGGRRPRATQPSEFDEKVLEVNRVTRVVKGGKRMRFRTLVVIGDRRNRSAHIFCVNGSGSVHQHGSVEALHNL